MKALLMVVALVSSFTVSAYDAMLVPSILVRSVEVGTSVTFPGGPENNEVIVSFTAVACRTLSAQEFFGEVIEDTIFVYQYSGVDCFGPTRRQNLTINFYTSESTRQSYFLGNPILIKNQFVF